MAPPTHASILKTQRARVDKSKQWRKEEGYDATWSRLIDMYRGKQYTGVSKEDRLLVNISFSTVNVIAPSVAVNYPKITVNASKPEAAPHAIITEAVINYWWKHYKVRPHFRRAVKDFLIIGHGWMKTGYRYVEEAAIGTPEGDISDAVEGEPGSDVPVPPERQAVRDAAATPSTVITEDRPFAERVSIFDMFVDPDGTSMEDITWIAQRVRRRLSDVKSDKRYNKKARNSVEPRSWGKDEVRTDAVVDTDAGYVEVWEYYDIARGTMSVFSTGGDDFLVAPFKMPNAHGHPYTMIRNYDIPDFFYPMGDLEAIEPLQRELNETRTQMMNHRKRYARKYLVHEDAFDAKGRAALESNADNTMVPVKEGWDDLTKAVAEFPTVMTPPEFYNQSELIMSDSSTVSGVSEYQRGSLPEIRRTATEAAIVQDASNARAADKLATIEQAIGSVAMALVQLAQQYMTGEQVARVIGKDGKALWIPFDKDYITGEFDFDVEAGSTAPNNESFRRQSALQMVDAMAPFAQAGVIDMAKLAAHVLQTGFGVKNPESFMVQAQPAMAGAPAAPPGMPGMPPQGVTPPGQFAPGAIAPPAGTPADLSGIDPGILAALSSRLGLDTPNISVGG